MKILVFLQGTVLMHKNAIAHGREERVRQVVQEEGSVHDFATYIPVGNSVLKLTTWHQQGARIVYLSSHGKVEDVEKDKSVLRANGFPDGSVFYRQGDQQYSEIAESIMPDILIEDDCESIGGEKEMTYPNIRLEARIKIKSIVVKEFGGIDHLPDNLELLATYSLSGFKFR